MTVGYKIASGADLDTVFAPLGSGWPVAPATGLKAAGGADLQLRYAKLSAGTQAAATGYKASSGQDLNEIFAAYGSTALIVAQQPSAVVGRGTGQPSGLITTSTTMCAGGRGSGIYSYLWNFTVDSGLAFTAPNSPITAIKGTVAAGETVTNSFYCTINDGTTSINTNEIGCTLINTSPGNVDQLAMLCGTTSSNAAGYVSGSFGSLTPTTLGDGMTVIEIAGTTRAGASHYLIVIIEGFSSDPGQGYLTSIALSPGGTYTGSAGSYGYSSGQASWQWNNGPIWSNDEQVAVTVTRSD